MLINCLNQVIFEKGDHHLRSLNAFSMPINSSIVSLLFCISRRIFPQFPTSATNCDSKLMQLILSLVLSIFRRE